MNITRRTLMKSVSLGAAMAVSAPSILRAQEAKVYRLGITTPPGHPWNLAAESVGKRLAENLTRKFKRINSKFIVLQGSFINQFGCNLIRFKVS